jgi:IclR family acetate operon transcriptional repressor
MEKIAASGKDGLRTLERGLAVLELLGSEERGFPLSDVAKRLGLSVAVCHRILATLVKAGYVEQDPRTRWYQLGLKVLELRGATAGPMRIAAAARPYLRDLMLRAGLRAHLAVYRGGDVVYVDRVDTADTVARFVPPGRRTPAYATGLGKAILAFLPAADVAAYLARAPFPAFTPATTTEAEALRRILAEVRARGYALDRGEHEADIHCVAAPVLDYTGAPIAALSVAGRAAQVAGDVPRLAALVTASAAEVSRRFGHHAADELRPVVAQ